MNFIYISPHFPKTNWEFCERLKKNGVRVLGIADVEYDELNQKLKDVLTEYYKVASLENYDEVLKAVAYFTFKYGKIDWLESNNEYWLEQDAKLRTDFNISTGLKTDEILNIKEKSRMKEFYARGGISTARYHMVTDLNSAKKFIEKVAYPVVVKPNNGVGASNTYRIRNEKELEDFFSKKLDITYIMEEYVEGELVSYDAIVNADGEVLFEASITWEPTIMDIVNEGLDLYYYVRKKVPEDLVDAGRRTIKGFGVKSRFIHMEFFKLLSDKEYLGKKGEYIGLEVNMRPAGGYTPDMYNYANNTDVYQIWADMVVYNKITHANLNEDMEKNFCIYVSRRDTKNYVFSHNEVLEKYKDYLLVCERMPDLYAAAMGNNMYTAKFKSENEMKEFIEFVHKTK